MKIEINTLIPNLDFLRSVDISVFDGFYIGFPFCRKFDGNLSEVPDDMRYAIEYLKDNGKRVYLTTYATPITKDLDPIMESVDRAVNLGIDAVEVHNYGVMRMIHRNFPSLRIHMGSFANVYTDATAIKLMEYGVKRVTPNHELRIDEIEYIKDKSGIEVEFLLHGKIPLGISESCFSIEIADKIKKSCPEACKERIMLKRNGWILRNMGTLMLSGKDLCMIEHLNIIYKAGFSIFRINGFSEDPAYPGNVARIYRKAFDELSENGFAYRMELRNELLKYSTDGFCNGFYFGKSGRIYVDAMGNIHE